MVSVNTVISAQFARQANDKATREIQRQTQALSLGQRVYRASDDAAGLSISNKLTAQINGLEQAVRNAGDAISLAQTAETGIDGITAQLQRARELAVAMASDTLGEEERLAIQREIDQSMVSIATLVAATQFNAQPVLSSDEMSALGPQAQVFNQTVTGQVASKTTALPVASTSLAQHAQVVEVQQTTNHYTVTPSTSVQSYRPTVSVDTTAAELGPTWTSDGQAMRFTSARGGVATVYRLPLDGGAASLDDGADPGASQRFTAGDGAFRLAESGEQLRLQFKTNSNYWVTLSEYDLFPRQADGLVNYSFSPSDSDDTVRFAYTDVYGNLRSVEVNRETCAVSNSTLLISSDDTLDLQQNVMNLAAPPNLLYMNTADQTFKIEKVNDSGSTTLTYWDGAGSPPVGGYYTVSGSQVTFFNEARIGAQVQDDGQDYYRITQSPDNTPGTDYFAVSIPAGAEVYNMDGSDGPRSMKISIGGLVVDRSQLLSERPAAGTSPDAIYVNEDTQTIEIYGFLRPRLDETVTVTYLNGDVDGVNASHQALITSGVATGSSPSSAWATQVDTYNLVDGGDLTAERALRVYVGGNEVPYDSSAQSGFSFDPATGYVTLSGDYRPDLHDATPLQFKFVVDHTGGETSQDVSGIVLTRWPEIYNLDEVTGEPTSMRVYKNGVVLEHDGVNGFLYNAQTNNIELFGSARPDVSDTFSVIYIETLSASTQADDWVSYPLRGDVAGFVYSDANAPQTFDVQVNGASVPYDPSGNNGYRYNPDTGEIEIFGSYRPDARVPVDVVIEASSLLPQTPVGTEVETYDVPVPGAEAYGLSPATTPAAIEVTLNGERVAYDSSNGFTFDADTQVVSLHGTARPSATDGAAALSVRWVPQSVYEQSIPSGHIVARVLLDGQEVPLASLNGGSGYLVDVDRVKLVGDARPDAGASAAQLTVEHFADPSPFSLLSDGLALPDEVLRILPHMSGAIDAESIQVSVNGSPVPAAAIRLAMPNLSLDWSQITVTGVPVSVRIDYDSSPAGRAEPLSFQFQIGANANQHLGLQIEAFENMLFELYRDPVPESSAAARWLTRLDEALDFSNQQRANLGSFQNRLTHAADALLSTAANVTQARSRIQDADFAKVTTELTKAQIIAQGSQAMLAQATENLSQVLALLDSSRT